ncbi:uncharacterized protein LOC122250332 [Penaeus japonicus]|uniref:uncharacterized protein LOC122250332 n=1 Tax=Penaeus japonicus TaxID=27405 RepID=UPI001C712FA2|nr:uncharacterized protein LOC122250332 [Penaeus japonicus]XP_042867638.1 uncharacterized protein LOC122250332 [Penaeus japonicus]XP_042867639.1 uncharacterized protein LOC122250332 [Penaeus japonicus]
MNGAFFILHFLLVLHLAIKGCTANGVWADDGRPALQGLEVNIRQDPAALGDPHGSQDPRHGDRGLVGTSTLHALAEGFVRRFFVDVGSFRQAKGTTSLSERLTDMLSLLVDDLDVSKIRGQTKEGGGSKSEGRRRRSFSARSVAEPRFAFFPSFDAWVNEFQSTFKRDMIFNVAKVGGIAFLYYFAPGVLTWIESTFSL